MAKVNPLDLAYGLSIPLLQVLPSSAQAPAELIWADLALFSIDTAARRADWPQTRMICASFSSTL